MRNPDTTAIAKAIGIHKAGLTYELAWRSPPSVWRKAQRGSIRMMAIAERTPPHGRDDPPDSGTRLQSIPIAALKYTSPEGDCTQNPDGSFSCNFVAGSPSRTAPNGYPPPSQQECNNIDFIFDIFQGRVGDPSLSWSPRYGCLRIWRS
jgi:hypothetical protein